MMMISISVHGTVQMKMESYKWAFNLPLLPPWLYLLLFHIFAFSAPWDSLSPAFLSLPFSFSASALLFACSLPLHLKPGSMSKQQAHLRLFYICMSRACVVLCIKKFYIIFLIHNFKHALLIYAFGLKRLRKICVSVSEKHHKYFTLYKRLTLPFAQNTFVYFVS